MQLYWIPVLTSCLALLVAGVRSSQHSKLAAKALTWTSVAGVVVLIVAYHGVNSDWKTYRFFVENCYELRCTYFEPGYDVVTFISASTLGFSFLKFLLIACFVGSLAIAIRGSASRLVVILVVASVTVATLPLMLGAIRQALTLPLLLGAAFLLQKRRYYWALLAVVVASSLHYSALVTGLWYSIFWYLLGRNPTPPRMRTAMLLVGSFIGITYLALWLLTHSSLGETISLVARIGATGTGTDSISTGGIGRDLAILVERIAFALAVLVVFVRHAPSLSTTERVFLLMYIAGSAFFTSTFVFDRNIAGRTLATFRLADVLVIVTVLRSLRIGRLPLALIVGLLFVVLKSYMTMATVGFFDE